MKPLLASLLLLALATTAWADEEKGLYVGAGVGQSNVKADNLEDIGAVISDFESDATAFKVFGGWRFNRYLAAELDYLDLGSPDEDFGTVRLETELSGVAPYVVGSLAIGPVELFAKVGYLFYDLDVSASGQKLSSASQDDFIYGVGAGIVLFKHLQARLEYEAVDVSKTLDDVDAVWLSAAWRF